MWNIEINNMEIHHKRPKTLGGKDEYSNLLYVTYNVHLLRKKVGNHAI